MDIHLRPLVLSDIDEAFVEWHRNDDGHLDFFTGSRRSFSDSELKNWVTKNDGRTHFYLIEAADGEKIGTVKIGPVDAVNKTSDLVCLIGNRKYLGRGIAKMAIRLGNEIAFREHDIRRLHGGMYEQNIASIKAYTAAGWVVEGRMKGYYWVDEKPMDRICVACFNPAYFPTERHEN